MATYYSFGENLKRARKEKKMNQKELAEKMGITQQEISGYERDIRYPPIDRIYDIARILEVSIFDLVE